MADSQLPDRASLEFLKKRAKERLVELRRRDARSKLADAQLAVARDYGFPSWRALKAEVDRRRAPAVTAFFAACEAGDVTALRDMLRSDAHLVHERNAAGGTGLHLAVHHLEAIKLLLAHGADPNVREAGDNAYPLHFAGGAGGAPVVRALLDAGADVHGYGDVHQLEVIGWATCFPPEYPKDVVALLLERGAQHHIFSAIATQDVAAIQKLVEENPDALSRRLSPFENRQSALHYVISPPDGLIGGGFRTGQHYAMLDLLIELGHDLDAEDAKGRTPLALAMLKGDQEAMRRLKAAGARPPTLEARASDAAAIADAASTVKRLEVMIKVPNVRAAIEWYRAIGFTLIGEHEVDSDAAWAGVALGDCLVMFVPGGKKSDEHEVSLWFRTERIEELYRILKQRQLERAATVLAGQTLTVPEARFTSDLHDTFYGQREFSIVDLNGYDLNFAQDIEPNER